LLPEIIGSAHLSGNFLLGVLSMALTTPDREMGKVIEITGIHPFTSSFSIVFAL